ncbi:salicylic acid-binding protein 2 [Dorcoceras hygrometricum]|uniref:Salicylic acid-binding protein 2 n=1 Tax=Dorcoceras hygrometricum TaxID=472368 RepID=A0A2Z7CSA4_9LAMI|nr:salicylic acid-binding protein 2 [Dorcoceras hygrometricum]
MEFPRQKLHIVLVHGACHGAWCWYKLKPLLEAAGHHVTALDLSASGINPKSLNDTRTLVDYTTPLFEVMDSIPCDQKVVLVGHSLGGLNIAVAMDKYPQKIAAAVFLAAFMPDATHEPSYVLDQYCKRTPTEEWLDVEFSSIGTPEDPLTAMLFGPQFVSRKLYQLCAPQPNISAEELAPRRGARASGHREAVVGCRDSNDGLRLASVPAATNTMSEGAGSVSGVAPPMPKSGSVREKYAVRANDAETLPKFLPASELVLPTPDLFLAESIDLSSPPEASLRGEEIPSTAETHGDRILRIDHDEARLAARGCTWYEIKASTLRQSDIPSIRDKAGIADLYEIVIPHVHARAHCPPAGFHTFYVNQIERGLRFPVPRFITDLCNHLEISPSQLTPNSFSSLLSLGILLKFFRIPLSTYTLMRLVQIKRLGPGKFYISNQCVSGNPSSHKGWMSRYFFIKRISSRENPWGCDMSWRDNAYTQPPSTPEPAPELTDFLKAVVWSGSVANRLLHAREEITKTKHSMDGLIQEHEGLMKQLEEIQATHDKENKEMALELESSRTRAFRAEEENKALQAEVDKWKDEAANSWELGKEKFLQSKEFRVLCSGKALAFFEKGFDGCLAQFRESGYTEEEHPASFLDVERALANLPDDEEEEGSSSSQEEAPPA